MTDRRVRFLVNVLLLVAVMISCYRVYRWSPGAVQDCDSNYSLAAGEMLVKHGTLRLNAVLPDDCSSLPCYSPAQGRPYQIIEHTQRNNDIPDIALYYGYPLGSVILSLPLLHHYTTVRHLSCFGPDGLYFADSERLLQRKLAALVAALAVGVYFLIARTLLPGWAAVLVSLAFAFGSMTWSTLSRGMWSHTWLTVELGLAVWMLTLLVRYPDRNRIFNLVIGGILGVVMLSIHYTRPQAIVSIAAIVVYLGLFERQVLFATVCSALLAACATVGLSMYTFGQSMPPSVYNPSDIDGKDVFFRFWQLMLSPSRGLLVFCPFLLTIGYLLVAYRNNLNEWSRLLIPSTLAIGAHTAVLSAYVGWYGGSCYGPRYFCDVLPWFVLVSCIAVRGILNRSTTGFPVRKTIELTILMLLVTWSIFVHARGATSWAAWEWNYRSVQEDVRTAVTDWQHPQFLAGITFIVTPDGSYHELP